MLFARLLAVPDAMQVAFGAPRAGKLILVGTFGIVTSCNAFYIGGSQAICALADD